MENALQRDVEDQTGARISRVYRLLKYAIYNNFDVPEDMVRQMNKLKFDYESSGIWDADKSGELDIMIQKLTKVTYPTTMYSLKYTLETRLGKYMQLGYFALTVLTIILGCSAYYKMLGPSSPGYWPMVLSICLGMLGAELSLYFVILGLAKELALSEGDLPKQMARILLGAVVGYLAYVMFSMDSFGALIENKQLNALTNDEKLFLVMPFLMGYSVRLVFGILNKAIKSAELTLGLEDKSDELALRDKAK